MVMTHLKSALCLIGLTIGLSPSALALEKPKIQKLDGKIEWLYDYEEGKRLSKKSGKPIFVVFRCER